MPDSVPWQTRVHKTVVVGQWLALTVAIITDLFASGGAVESFGALAFASSYVVGSTLMPQDWYRRRFGTETITLLGALLMLFSLTFTGGATSSYLLLSMGPPILATLHGGFRVGFTTGLFSAGLLGLVTLATGGFLVDAAPEMALYLIFVLLVGVITKLLEDIHRQAAHLAVEKETATAQLERLEQIHGALLKLSEDISAGRLNAMEVGAETLDTILTRHPGSAGKLAIHDQDGVVVLAARGVPEENGHVYEFPLATKDADVGSMELTAPEALTPLELADIAAVLHPVSVAFANLQLLQDIVGSAVAEERMRLARELHDEIGPSLASLGLAFDMAVMQQDDQPEVAADLRILRSNVTKLVEDVRAAVADLRNAPGPTLTARILQSTALLDGGPQVVVDIDERRPPRPGIIGDLTAIITEATRNAHKHSKATRVLVSGQVDKGSGTCTIMDDGVGFDPENEPDGHYGLIGMRERAAKLGASIKFDSQPGAGTAVTLEWGAR